MPLDEDVNEAISSLHFGATLPFWEAAVVLQARRLSPVQDWVVQRLDAGRRCDEGVGTADDVTARTELSDRVQQLFEAGEGPFFYSVQDRVDSVFLLLAIRSILTMADRIVTKLERLGKGAEAASARDAFLSKFPVLKTPSGETISVIKALRDVTIHYDEYAIGFGKYRELINDPDEGLGVVEGDDGHIYITWAGYQVNVLEAASAALDLSRALSDMFWGDGWAIPMIAIPGIKPHTA